MHLIDTSIIRANHHAAGGKKGPDHAIDRSRVGLSTKINALVRKDGLPLRIVLSAGQASDKTAFESLIDDLKPAEVLVADRGYDAHAVIDLVASHSGCDDITIQRDRRVQCAIDLETHRKRNVVERYLYKLKQFRLIATRFDKLARNFLGFVVFADIRLWIRHFVHTALLENQAFDGSAPFYIGMAISHGSDSHCCMNRSKHGHQYGFYQPYQVSGG